MKRLIKLQLRRRSCRICTRSKTIHEKAPKGETVKEKHERHEQERLAAVESKKAAVDADETAHKITAAEKELQDLYKEQLSEKMAAPLQNEHKPLSRRPLIKLFSSRWMSASQR